MLYLFSLFTLSRIGLRPNGLILPRKTKGTNFKNKSKFINIRIKLLLNNYIVKIYKFIFTVLKTLIALYIKTI